MKTLVSITALRQEMANIRKKITQERATAEAYLEMGASDLATWHIKMIGVWENGLKWRASAIRREQRRRKEVQHG